MTGVEEIDTEVPILEVAPHPDPGRQYVGQAGRVLQVCNDGGGSRATMTEAGGGVDNACTGFSNATINRPGLAMEAEFGVVLAGLESRVDVAVKDSFALVAAVYGEAKARRMHKEMKAQGEWKVRWDSLVRREFWADVGWCSDQLRTSADQQTMAPRGASEQVGKVKMSS